MTILYDYWAPWCPPCKQMNPIIDEIEKENPDISVIRVNIDEDKEKQAEAAGVMSLPTYIVLKEVTAMPEGFEAENADGIMEETDRFIGAVSKQKLIDALK